MLYIYSVQYLCLVLFLRPPAGDQLIGGGGGGLLPEEVEAHVGKSICEFSPAEAALVMAIRPKCQQVALIPYSGLSPTKSVLWYVAPLCTCHNSNAHCCHQCIIYFFILHIFIVFRIQHKPMLLRVRKKPGTTVYCRDDASTPPPPPSWVQVSGL